MRFVRLVVDRFAAIEHADVDFRPGLNVLHGPNDLGKSTLAAAIRAALLLPHGSSEALAFVPWQGDFTPRVELTFADAGNRFWKVTKSFGSGHGSSVLESSKDGRDFVGEAKGREVDERLRKLLEWGAPDAGARSGPRGLPETFIAHALLAAQTDVDAILKESLEADPAESGRLRLTKALEAFALDPRFKKLLDQAEAECDLLFSQTGKQKRGRGSPFVKASEEVRKLREELDDLDGQLRATDEAEGRLKALREESIRLAELRDAAYEELSRARLVAAGRQSLAEAVERLRGIEAAHATVEEKSRELTAMAGRARALEEGLAQARTLDKSAGLFVENANKTLLQATNQKAASQRAIRKAEMEKELGDLCKVELGLAARKKEAEEALALAAKVASLERQKETLEKKAREAASRRESADRALENSRASRKQLQDLLAYGRWAEAARELDSAVRAREEARQLTAQAAQTRSLATALRAGVASQPLPDSDAVRAILDLEQELRLAEAALGGGLSATVRPRKGVTVEIRADDGEARHIEGESTVEASRAIELTIGDLVDVRILAGDAEKRRQADTLRHRWSKEARPLLALLAVETGAALTEARSKADDALRAAEALERDAQHLLEMAKERDSRGPDVARHERRVADLEVALEGCDREALAGIVKKVGVGWEAQTEGAERRLAIEERAALEERSAASSELAGVAGQLGQLEESLSRARGESDRARAVVGDAPEERLRAVEREAVGLAAQAARLSGEMEKLESAGGKATATARAQVEQAKRELVLAAQAVNDSDERARKARSGHDKAFGELEALRKHAEALPRGEAEREVRRCQDAVSELTGSELTGSELTSSELPLTEPDVKKEQARHDELDVELVAKRAELNQAEGALTQVGGAVVRERHDSLKAAYGQATERQRDLELDADAWMLLRNTLRDSESVGVQHIGKALSGEVDRKFGELTGHRYGSLEMDPHLRVKGIQSAGDLRETDVLSAGTREQLATLLRLAIAESLGTAIVLDDQLVQTDSARLEWFRTALHRAAALVQVVVLTCRRSDYVEDEPGPGVPARNVVYVDLTERIRRVGMA